MYMLPVKIKFRLKLFFLTYKVDSQFPLSPGPNSWIIRTTAVEGKGWVKTCIFRTFCHPKWKFTVVQICESFITMKSPCKTSSLVVWQINRHVPIGTFEVNLCEIWVSFDKQYCLVKSHMGIILLHVSVLWMNIICYVAVCCSCG